MSPIHNKNASNSLENEGRLELMINALKNQEISSIREATPILKTVIAEHEILLKNIYNFDEIDFTIRLCTLLKLLLAVSVTTRQSFYILKIKNK
ncbi:hypothetical protein PABG_12074 [Paracoccidioides brasiliensis Pb03]|nr:hypothetical protein PABG_12074 [Paracoccidioides brasiliensis Pb03]